MTEAPSDTSDQVSADSGDYRVLARKYRPGTFSELIGQEPMVRTLRNAVESGRLAHAFVLTGVRGVGKTTTARLIARALNCIGPDGTQQGATTNPCGQCEHCLAIAESRHVDVIEMDAASRTGVDDVREIIESVRYAPSDARFKVYIIDEVHMLSRNAFNALLKTLEEPPEHVKFVFATTEIRKVPVTVLSRCQRFDLRRVEQNTLKDYFADVSGREGVSLDDEALGMIARAADGSVRDGLSLLDQAIAHGAGTVSAEQVRDMLGLADRALILDLFEQVMAGDIKAALANLRSQYNAGADPATVLQDLLELTHWVTQLKAVPEGADDQAVSDGERDFGKRLAGQLPMPALTRAWQMLLKGLEETRMAPSPIGAAEMILIRLSYAADLPSPADLVRTLRDAPADSPAAATTSAAPSPEGNGQPPSNVQPEAADPRPAPPPPQAPTGHAQSEPQAQAEGSPQPQSFEQVVALVAEHREPMLETHLTDNAHLVRFQPGRIELRLTERAPPDLAGRLSQKLSDWTGSRWVVSVKGDGGDPTLQQQKESAEQALHAEVSTDPLVQAAMDAFPGARITAVIEEEAPEDLAPIDTDSELEDDDL